MDTSAAQGSTTIFIKNMPWSATEESIREFFAPAGEVVEVRIGALSHAIIYRAWDEGWDFRAPRPLSFEGFTTCALHLTYHPCT